MIFHRYQRNLNITKYKRLQKKEKDVFLGNFVLKNTQTGIKSSTLTALNWYSLFKSSGFKYIPSLSCLPFREFNDSETGCLEGKALKEWKTLSLFISWRLQWLHLNKHKQIVFFFSFSSPASVFLNLFPLCLRQYTLVQYFVLALGVFKDRIRSII